MCSHTVTKSSKAFSKWYKGMKGAKGYQGNKFSEQWEAERNEQPVLASSHFIAF